MSRVECVEGGRGRRGGWGRGEKEEIEVKAETAETSKICSPTLSVPAGATRAKFRLIPWSTPAPFLPATPPATPSLSAPIYPPRAETRRGVLSCSVVASEACAVCDRTDVTARPELMNVSVDASSPGTYLNQSRHISYQ